MVDENHSAELVIESMDLMCACGASNLPYLGDAEPIGLLTRAETVYSCPTCKCKWRVVVSLEPV